MSAFAFIAELNQRLKIAPNKTLSIIQQFLCFLPNPDTKTAIEAVSFVVYFLVLRPDTEKPAKGWFRLLFIFSFIFVSQN